MYKELCTPSVTHQQIHCRPKHALPLFLRPSADFSKSHSDNFGSLPRRLARHIGLDLPIWLLFICGILRSCNSPYFSFVESILLAPFIAGSHYLMIPPIVYCLRRVDAPRTAYMRGIDFALVEFEFSENSQTSSKRGSSYD